MTKFNDLRNIEIPIIDISSQIKVANYLQKIKTKTDLEINLLEKEIEIMEETIQL